jgi:hypothetical protein
MGQASRFPATATRVLRAQDLNLPKGWNKWRFPAGPRDASLRARLPANDKQGSRKIDRVSQFDPHSPQESRFQATGQLKDLRAHLTRFELVTFAFGGQRSGAQTISWLRRM